MLQAWAIALALLVAATSAASSQAWQPPYCSGTNVALQYDQRGWICATISGVQGPAGPAGPPGPAMPAAPDSTQCITARWDGAAWQCVPTIYLEAR